VKAHILVRIQNPVRTASPTRAQTPEQEYSDYNM